MRRIEQEPSLPASPGPSIAVYCPFGRLDRQWVWGEMEDEEERGTAGNTTQVVAGKGRKRVEGGEETMGPGVQKGARVHQKAKVEKAEKVVLLLVGCGMAGGTRKRG